MPVGNEQHIRSYSYACYRVQCIILRWANYFKKHLGHKESNLEGSHDNVMVILQSWHVALNLHITHTCKWILCVFIPPSIIPLFWNCIHWECHTHIEMHVCNFVECMILSGGLGWAWQGFHLAVLSVWNGWVYLLSPLLASELSEISGTCLVT